MSATFLIALWSAVIFPDSTILVDYMLAKMTAIVTDMRVFSKANGSATWN